MSDFKLFAEIIARSDGDSWDEAKLEWDLAEIHIEAEPKVCLCGHQPINEICVIRNRVNGNEAEVGNVCVKKFLGLPSAKIFQAIGRIAQDDSRALNVEAIEHAYERGWIDEYKRGFYLDTWRMRVLTDKQMRLRKRINRIVLNETKR